MRKILSLTVALLLVLALAACGQQTPAPAPSSSQDTQAPAKTEVDPEVANFPTRPVEVIVPWAAGGGADLVFRALADVFSTYSGGQPLVINNLEGAGGAAGTSEFLSAPADGYHLLHYNVASITRAHMSKVPFDVHSFEPVIKIVQGVSMILVREDAPWQTFDEFLADAKANPGQITMGNAGAGGGAHLIALVFETRSGTEFIHTPYGGGGPAVTGLLAGEIDCMMATSPEGLSNIEAGQFRILATLGSERMEQFPDVPTVMEYDIDLFSEPWRGIMAPAGTPPEIIERLHEIIKEAISDERYIKAMLEMDQEPVYMGPKDFGQFLLDEDAMFYDVIKSNKLGDIYGA